MSDTTGTSPGPAPGTAETPNPEGGPVERLERRGQDGAASPAGGDGTGGSVNTDDASAAGPGPTAETSKDGG